MRRVMLLTLLISAHCMQINFDEEPNTTETAIEISDKTGLLSAGSEPLQSKAENNEAETEVGKASELGEEVRVSRSSYTNSTKKETKHSSKLHTTEDSLTEKSAPDEVADEVDKQADEEEKEPEEKTASADPVQHDTKSAENMETQLEDVPETARSGSEPEDRKSEDTLEASAESKLSGNEKASTKLDETDRNSETKTLKEKSDESGFDESLETRRMFSGPDYIVVDTKMRADTSSNAGEPEVKTALNQNLNTYNNFNEFGTDDNTKLTDSSLTEPSSINMEIIMPGITKSAPQEIFNQQYFPKFDPQPELNINFPNINSDFQGPRDLPIYLKVKQDVLQPKNQFLGAPNLQFKSDEEVTHLNSRNQQLHHEYQIIQDTLRTSKNKQLQDLKIDTKNQVPQFYQNPISQFHQTEFPQFNQNELPQLHQNELPQLHQNELPQLPQNKFPQFYQNQMPQFYQNQVPTVHRFQDLRNVQQFNHNQEKTNLDYKLLENLNREPRNQMQETVNTKTPLYNNEHGNQYPLFNQPQETIGSRMNLENRPIGAEINANPYSFLQPAGLQQFNPLKAMTRNINVNPNKVKILFHKLPSATDPRKVPINLYGNNNVQPLTYPYFSSPNFIGDSSFFDLQTRLLFPNFL